MTDRERIYNLVDKVCDLSIKAIDKITKLKQENSELKKRVAELENSAKDTNVRSKKSKRKFRAMTNAEFCDKWRKNHLFCKSIVSGGYCCPISPTGNCFRESFLNKPYIINGKYILVEVTNDA